MGINPFNAAPSSQLGRIISDLVSRMERLEQRDSLTRVHPVTGDTGFEGTVIRSPDGTPVFLVSAESGVEIPGLVLQSTSSGTVSLSDFTPVNNWFPLHRWIFPQALTDSVEIITQLNTSPSTPGQLASGEIRLVSQILDRTATGFNVVSTEGTSDPYTQTGGASGSLRTFRWIHGLPNEVDTTRLYSITLEARRTTADTAVSVEPVYSVLRGKDILTATTEGTI